MKDSDGFRVFAPVTSRGEAVGVLELGLEAEPDQPALAIVSAGAHALAYIVIANRRFTDLFDWGQRSVPLSLEAELQHRLLPASYTCEGPIHAGQMAGAGRRCQRRHVRFQRRARYLASPSLMRWAR